MIQDEVRSQIEDSIATESQTNFFDVILPELSHTDGYIMLNNAKHLEELLTYLENTLSSIQQDSISFENSQAITIPPIDIFRILLTLASRHPKINYSVQTTIIGDSFFASDKHEDYDSCIFKHTLKERSIFVLRRYLTILAASKDKSLFSIDLLHTNITQLILDFVESPKTTSRINPKSLESQTFSHRSHDIKNPSPLHVNTVGVDMVSDSEDDLVVLKSLDYTDRKEQEVKKYKMYNTHPVKNSQMHGLQGRNTRLSPTQSTKNSRSNSPSANDKKKIHYLEKIKIFGDNILGYSLNKNLNLNYSIWDILTWTFFCAKASTEEERNNHKNSHYSSIFQTYNDVLSLIIDLITYNFCFEINSYIGSNFSVEAIESFKTLESYKARIHNYFNNSNDSTILSRLLHQLECSSYDICDRTVNTLFIGLSGERLAVPIPLFERDMSVIKNGKSEDSVSSGIHSNSLTIKLRFKFLQVLYLRSILFEIGSTTDNYFSSERFIRQIALNLLSVDVGYVKEFFVTSLNEDLMISRFYRERMVLQICKFLITELVSPIKRKSLVILKKSSSKNVEKFLKYIIKMVRDKDMYLSIVEDETFTSIQDFEQAWYKLNFAIEWIFMILLGKFEETPKTGQIEDFLHQIKKADKMRKKYHQNFLLRHYETNGMDTSFRLTIAQFSEMQGKQEWIDFSELLKMRFFIQ